MIIYGTEQGSDEWHALRSTKVTSTDSAVILGVDPWTTPYQLMLRKRGLEPEKEPNKYMLRGQDLEPVARAAYIAKTGHPMVPVCIGSYQHQWIMSSLDGVDDTYKRAVEIKCLNAEQHQMALDGVIPERCFVQCQHHLLAFDNSVDLDYWSFDGEKGVCLPVEINSEIQDRILKEGKKFYDLLESGGWPELTERDYKARDDASWRIAVQVWDHAKEELERAKALESAARKDLINLCQGASSKGCGVAVRRSVRKGDIDFRQIPELSFVDLDQYRKPSIVTWTIRKTEGGEYETEKA
jgi:putative phage-type endonuclease